MQGSILREVLSRGSVCEGGCMMGDVAVECRKSLVSVWV
jgi:hypothetical protein